MDIKSELELADNNSFDESFRGSRARRRRKSKRKGKAGLKQPGRRLSLKKKPAAARDKHKKKTPDMQKKTLEQINNSQYGNNEKLLQPNQGGRKEFLVLDNSSLVLNN